MLRNTWHYVIIRYSYGELCKFVLHCSYEVALRKGVTTALESTQIKGICFYVLKDIIRISFISRSICCSSHTEHYNTYNISQYHTAFSAKRSKTFRRGFGDKIHFQCIYNYL